MSTVKIIVDTKGMIPLSILTGRAGKFWRPVRRVLLVTFLTGLLQRIYDSYLERSHLDDTPDMKSFEQGYSPKRGREDDLGNSWVQLRPQTYRIKKDIIDGGYQREYIDRRLASRSKTNRTRAEAVSKILDNTDFDSDGINIRTGELLESYHPPIIGDNQQSYFGKGQEIVIKGLHISFKSIVTHAEDVNNSIRPITKPAWETIWMQEANDEAIAAAYNKYQELLQARELANSVRREEYKRRNQKKRDFIEKLKQKIRSRKR